MNAFEKLVESLLRHEGFWTATSVKVKLTAKQKVAIGRPSSPRWEIDVVAYKGKTNELLVVECKSYLDSHGVTFRNGRFEPLMRYKLFTEPTLRRVVVNALKKQLVKQGACRRNPRVKLCLATAKIASRTDRAGLRALFNQRGWTLYDEDAILEKIAGITTAGYEDDIAFVLAKILGRTKPKSS